MSTADKFAKDVASYLLNTRQCHFPDNFDGNMKLQKMLVNANLIHFVKNESFLFNNDMFAFRNGIVVEDVRIPFQKNYTGFTNELTEHRAELTESEKQSIDLAVDLFYRLSASELSDLHHELDTWKHCYNRSLVGTNSHYKPLGRIDLKRDLFQEDIKRMQTVVEAYEEADQSYKNEVVNGVTFFYDPEELSMDDTILEYLEDISRTVRTEDAPYFLTTDEDLGVYYY